MNRLLKLFVMLLWAEVASTYPGQAQIAKLPIGSISEIVDHTATNTDIIGIQVVSIVRQADGSIAISAIVDREYSYDPSQKKLEDFVRQKITESLNGAINLKDMSLASVKFGASYIGLSREQNQDAASEFILFFAGNNFSLERNSTGGLAIPAFAYEVNLTEAIAGNEMTTFFVPGVSRVVVEVFDENGQVSETQDSSSHQLGDDTVSVLTDKSGFSLPMKRLFGMPGRITITYQSGTKQAFNLSDGRPELSSNGEFRKLTAPRITSSGVEFYVEGIEGDLLSIETTANLGTPWTRINDITGFSALPEKRLLKYPTNTVGRGFFRARIISKR
jgi:hypothetical protein